MIKKKLYVLMVLASTLTFFSMTSYAAAFSDIEGHWAKETIEWGNANGFVSGYPDGSFQPDKQVTEAEFTTMLIANFHLKLNPVSKPKHWADQFYQYAKKMNYPLAGFKEIDARDQPITRSHVAELITSVQGENLEGDEAIKYLLLCGFSGGKTADTVEGFAGNDNLTRAEAISFIYNMQGKSQNPPESRPSAPTNTANLDKQYAYFLKKQQPND